MDQQLMNGKRAQVWLLSIGVLSSLLLIGFVVANQHRRASAQESSQPYDEQTALLLINNQGFIEPPLSSV